MTDAARHRAALVRLAVAGALVVGTLGTACADGEGSPDALGVEITDSDGRVTSLADLAGSPLVVNLWATWCTPCVAEMPAFDEVASALAEIRTGEASIDPTPRIVGVNVGDDADEARRFALGLGVGYPILTDPDGALSAALGVTGLPATAFVATDGTVLEVRAGAFTRRELEEAIARHFGSAS